MDTRGSKRRLSNDDNDDSQPGESVSQVCALSELQHYNTQVMCTHGKHDEALKLGIVPIVTVCHPCHDDLRRIGSDPNHVPRWEKKDKQ